LNVEDVTSGSTVANIQDMILRQCFMENIITDTKKFEDTKGVIRINNIHTELAMQNDIIYNFTLVVTRK
jgi:hypothetical protein